MEKKVPKKFLIPAMLLADCMVVALVLLDCFVMNVPSALLVFVSALAIAFCVAYCAAYRGGVLRVISKIFFCVLTLIFFLSAMFFAFCFPYRNSSTFRTNGNKFAEYGTMLTRNQAIGDFDFAYHSLKKVHPAMLDKNGSEYAKVKSAYENERKNLLAMEKVSVNQLARSVESVFSVLEDAHTTVNPKYQNLHYFKDVDPIKKSGMTFVGINGTYYSDLVEEKRNLFSYEKKEWALSYAKNFSIQLEMLDYLGFDADEGVTYMLQSEDGKIVNRHATKNDFLTYDEYFKYNQIETDSDDSSGSFCSYTLDLEHSLAVLTLKSCINNSYYRDLLRKMFTEIKDSGIKNVAVDVRDNGGGNSLVINSFFEYLDIDSFRESTSKVRLGPFMLDFDDGLVENVRQEDLLFRGNVYVLTSSESFSSAMMFPQFVKDNGIGKVIGETPANNPNGYGDTVVYYLPKSRIFMQISFKKFGRVNQNTSEKFVEPDFPCKADEALELLYDIVE